MDENLADFAKTTLRLTGAPPTDVNFLRQLGASALAFSAPSLGGPPTPEGYEIIEEIGRGGMGVVYLARQTGLERIVALKVLHPGRIASVEADARLRREAQTAARLRHRHIVAVHESGQSGGQFFYSMDYFGGGDLATRLRMHVFRPREAAEMVRKLADAVAHAHQAGVVHRDLKPGNVLLDEAGEPRIADFGLAASIEPGDDLTAVTSVLGTPHYLAPEGFTGGSAALGVASDVYALGAILYELLTGRAPFAGVNSAELAAIVAASEPAAPRLFNASVERDLQTICLKCLEKTPERRYRTAQELADDLGRWLRLEPILARPVSPPARAWRWARRRPALAAAWLLLMLLAFGAAVSAAWIARERAAATSQLRAALVAQARSARLTGQIGQRLEALDALRRAGEIRAGSDLRDEAIAALALPDARIVRRWNARASLSTPVGFTPGLCFYVTERAPGVLALRRVDNDAELRAFEPLPGQPRATFVGPFSADGERFVARFAGGTVAVFSRGSSAPLRVLTGRAVRQPHIYFAADLWLSADGRFVGCAHPEGGASIHDVATGEETARFRVPGEESVPSSVFIVSSDEKRVALITPRARRAVVLDRATGALIAQAEHSAALISASWHPKGHLLVTTAVDNNLQLWNTATGALVGVLEGHFVVPIECAWHQNGTVLASSGRDYSVRLWDIPTRRPLLEIPGIGGGAGLRFSPDGHRLAFTGSEHEAVIAELVMDDVRRRVSPLPPGDYFERPTCLDFEAGGRVAALASRESVRLVDPASGRELARLDGPRPGEVPTDIRTVLFSPRGDAVWYSASRTGVWSRSLRWRGPDELVVGPPVQLDAEPGLELTAADPTGHKLLLNVERSRRTILWHLPEKRRMELGLEAIVSGAAFSPDGRWLLTAEHAAGQPSERVAGQPAERACKLWDAESGTLLRTLSVGEDVMASSLPGTDLVFLATSRQGGLRRWPDLAAVPADAPGGFPVSSRDGRLLLISGQSRAQLFRVADRHALGALPLTGKFGPRFHPDGTHLFVHSDQRLEAWDLSAMRLELAKIRLDWEGGEFRGAPQPPAERPVRVILE